MTKVKICGLTTPEDITAVNAAMPDYIGFVFAPSRRRVTQTQAASLKAGLSPDIAAVGVFVNAPMEEIIPLADQGTIDLIQLHGDETDDFIHRLKENTNIAIIRAIRVRTAADIVRAASSPSDYLLFDTFVKDAFGGSGRTFDWSLIPLLDRPFFLAGGLKESNLCQAARTNAFCLDVSSGAETNGHKDSDKIKHIVQTIRTIRRIQS